MCCQAFFDLGTQNKVIVFAKALVDENGKKLCQGAGLLLMIRRPKPRH